MSHPPSRNNEGNGSESPTDLRRDTEVDSLLHSDPTIEEERQLADELLRNTEDPTARMLAHISNRQLVMSEILREMQHSMKTMSRRIDTLDRNYQEFRGGKAVGLVSLPQQVQSKD